MEASARLTPNSACTAGNTTATTYMLLPPRVIKARVTSKRLAAYAESIRCSAAAVDELMAAG